MDTKDKERDNNNLVEPGIGRLHVPRVMRRNAVRTHREYPFILALPWVFDHKEGSNLK